MTPGVTTDVARIPMQVVEGCVVASIQIELGDEVLHVFQNDLLELVRSSRARGVVLDLTGVQIIDRHDFESIRRTLSMAGLMGAVPVIVGVRPGIAASLAELGVATSGVHACLSLERAFDLIACRARGVPG